MRLERKDNDWEESELVQEEDTDKEYIHARALDRSDAIPFLLATTFQTT